MVLFKQTVTARADRLFEEAVERFPLIRGFARDSDVQPDDAADSHRDFRDALGITTRDRNLRGASAQEVRAKLSQRGDVLSASIAARLDSEGILKSPAISHRPRTSRLGSWVAFELSGGTCVELILKWTDSAGVSVQRQGIPNSRPARQRLSRL